MILTSLLQLAKICERKFGCSDERCLIFPSKKVADHCRAFMQEQTSRSGSPMDVRLIHFLICPEDKQNSTGSPVDVGGRSQNTSSMPSAGLHIVLFPADAFPLAKQFWQHSGLGISSRMAEHCLSMLPDSASQSQPSSPAGHFRSKSMNKHYSAKNLNLIISTPSRQSDHVTHQDIYLETMKCDQNMYVEERYGRNLSLSLASSAKRALRRRIAGVLDQNDLGSDSSAGAEDINVGQSVRGVASVTEDDVFLFPSGMSAIWTAHNVASAIRPPAKSVCFGFVHSFLIVM
jgi:cystathionine gamma-synthase